MMFAKIVAAKYQGDHKIWLRFDNGADGVADFSDEEWRGTMKEPLANKQFFRFFAIDESGALAWVNGFDMCPDYLYQKVTGHLPADQREMMNDQ